MILLNQNRKIHYIINIKLSKTAKKVTHVDSLVRDMWLLKSFVYIFDINMRVVQTFLSFCKGYVAVEILHAYKSAFNV